MGRRAVAAVAGEMWEPAFGAGFQAPRANQESQVSYSSRPPAARHFHSKAANSAHFLRNRIFGLPDGLKSSFSRKPPKMHPSSDSCAVPVFENFGVRGEYAPETMFPNRRKDLPLQTVVGRNADGILYAPLFQRLVDLRLGEGSVGTKDYFFAQSLLSLNLRQ